MYPWSPRLGFPLPSRYRIPWWRASGGLSTEKSRANICTRPFSATCHLHSSHRDGDDSYIRTHDDHTGNGPWREPTPLADQPRLTKSTIFDELFPDADFDSMSEKDSSLSVREQRPTSAFRESPVCEVLDKGDLVSWLERQRKQARLDCTSLPPRDHMPAMLVLWNASKSLAESDFYRVGCQSDHVHGWNGSIRKVVQLFDINTLEPLDSYFIFFASRAAARAYKLQAHALFGPLRHATSQQLSSPLVQGPFRTLSSSEGQTFTLAPPSPAPLSLKLYALPGSTEARVQPYTIEHILASASVHSFGSARGSASNTRTSTSTTHHQHVIVSLEGGAVDTPTFRDLVHQDGHARNLAWDLTDLKPYFARKLSESRPDGKRRHKKVPNNKSNDKANDAKVTTGIGGRHLRPVHDAWVATLQGNHGRGRRDEGTKGTDADGCGSASASSPNEGPIRSARFVMTFRDALEAQRFVRSWHRREFLVNSPHTLEVSSSLQTTNITVNAIMPF